MSRDRLRCRQEQPRRDGMRANAKLGNGDVAGMGVLIVGLFFISKDRVLVW